MQGDAYAGRIRIGLFFLTAVCLLFLAVPAASAADDPSLTVNWFYPDQPPIFITEGIAEGDWASAGAR